MYAWLRCVGEAAAGVMAVGRAAIKSPVSLEIGTGPAALGKTDAAARESSDALARNERPITGTVEIKGGPVGNCWDSQRPKAIHPATPCSQMLEMVEPRGVEPLTS